jgi:hypothetical protein
VRKRLENMSHQHKAIRPHYTDLIDDALIDNQANAEGKPVLPFQTAIVFRKALESAPGSGQSGRSRGTTGRRLTIGFQFLGLSHGAFAGTARAANKPSGPILGRFCEANAACAKPSFSGLPAKGILRTCWMAIAWFGQVTSWPGDFCTAPV